MVPLNDGKIVKPIVISTWDFGVAANKAAWEVLINRGTGIGCC